MMKATAMMAEELKIIEKKMPPTNAVSRRIAIRSLFSSVEILLSEISVNLINMVRPPVVGASHEEKHRYFLELCALSDISYEIRQNGTLVIKAPRIQFENRVLFVLNLLDKTIGRQVKPKEIEGWQEFQDSIKIRNRITHPKTKDDLAVSQEDYDTVIRGFQWFVRCHHRACGGHQY